MADVASRSPLGRAFSNADAHLPERVRGLIAAQEAESERLISWAQLAVVGTFALLFLIAPRPADAGMSMYEPVPIAIGAYLLFTITRLSLAYRGAVPGWLLVVSILIDMTLLLGLIWSFHLQYGQPAAFSLKIPTFIYIFVFIALRALRFDHRYVLSAGLFAATGWLVLLAMTVGDGGEQAITRNFVTYLTSNTILLGAEFDKVFTILLVTGILTYAVYRARRILVTAVSEEAAGREIKRFLSKGVAEAIAGAETRVEAGQASERSAAIMMLDIRGFTRFSTTVPAKEVVDMLTGFHARVLPAIERHGGVVDKFLGDGVMATFGAVTASERAAADALRALDDVMMASKQWTADLAAGPRPVVLAVNGAVAAGPVVFAALGSANRLEYTVIGEAANLAAKLEKHNKSERTRAIVSAKTYALAEAQGYRRDEPPGRRVGVSVAGVPEPLDLVVMAE